MSNENILEVEGLKKYFYSSKKFWETNCQSIKAVDGISFKLKRGSSMGLVGESGCGKSTAGRTILNLLEPTEGKIVFNEKVLYDSEKNIHLSKKDFIESRKDMQIIFQDPYACLDPRMNIQEIVCEGMIKHFSLSNEQAKQRAIELLSKCGMSHEDLKKYPHQFSGGQRQRIGIARALSLNPVFIVCDEPTAALDVSIQSQILNLMRDLKNEMNLSYLFISHDLNIVKNFCDEVCVMYLGKVVERGKSIDVFNRKYHPYTRALISAIPSFDPEEKGNVELLYGEIPSPMDPPKGCRFHTRCNKAITKCKMVEPILKMIDENHYVACHLY